MKGKSTVDSYTTE